MTRTAFCFSALAVLALLVGVGQVAEVRAAVMTTSATWSGNGHTYEAWYEEGGIGWHDAKAAAEAAGGYLATLTSAAENEFVFSLIDDPIYWRDKTSVWHDGPWLGGYQPAGSPEPDGNWMWVTNEPFDFQNWWPELQPDNYADNQDFLHFWGLDTVARSSYWDDVNRFGIMSSYIVERATHTPFSLDIKPGSDENPLNLKSKGVLPVSILSTDVFDALAVNPDTLLFGDPLLIDKGATGVSPIRFNENDVNDDGLLDLTLFFSMPELVGGGALDSTSAEVFLMGAMTDGSEIIGSDMVRIVPKPKGSVLGAIDEAEALALGGSASISPIPEPSTLALLCMGAFGFLVYVRRRR